MTDHDRAWLTEVVGEHLVTTHEETAWVPVAARAHISNDTETK